MGERVMDSNALEQERGITILAKNTAISGTIPKTMWNIALTLLTRQDTPTLAAKLSG